MVFRFHFLKLILLFNDLSFENTNNGVGCNKYLCKAEEIYERQYVFGQKLKHYSNEMKTCCRNCQRIVGQI